MIHKGFTILTLLCLSATGVQATTHQNEQRLLERIEALEKRVSELEAARTFAAFMPDFAERFHVMHRAGEAGDWAVATHELLELKRMMNQADSIDEERGKRMQSMLGPSLDRIQTTIEHENKKKFIQALVDTTRVCNACHIATGSEFINVTLDPPDNLSMRHPHALRPSEAPTDHRH